MVKLPKYKPFLSLDKQINHLVRNKNVVFENKRRARNYLLNKNYFNIVSTAKIIFCDRIVDSKHNYSKPSNFSAWQIYYENERKLAFSFLKILYDFENQFNSRLAYYTSELLAGDLLVEREVAAIYKYINRTMKARNKYHGEETWEFITKFMFAESIGLYKLICTFYHERAKEKNNLRLLIAIVIRFVMCL